MKNIILIFLLISACQSSQEAEVIVKLYDYDVEQKVTGLGIELKAPSKPIANYVNAVKVGDLVFLSGNGPRKADGEFMTGKVGVDLSIEEGYEAARLTGINQLASLKAAIGNLNKVVRVVKVRGMVNAAPSFTEHPAVINGYSDLMVEVFGERGKHARAAVGMGSLPMNIPCEIEMIVQVRE